MGRRGSAGAAVLGCRGDGGGLGDQPVEGARARLHVAHQPVAEQLDGGGDLGRLQAVEPRREHLLDGLVGAVARVRQLVDRVPVAVFLHRGGAGGVLTAIEVPPVDQRVERGGEIVGRPALRLLRRQLSELRRDVRLRGGIDEIPREMVPDLLAVIRELVTNVVRHASARRVTVTVSAGNKVRVVVADDGIGLSAVTVRSGLANLADRAERRGGRLTATGGPAGTEVRWMVPWDGGPAEA